MNDAIENLRKAKEIMEDRMDEYGKGYLQIGDIMSSFFPSGHEIGSVEEFSRYATFQMCVTKLARYANNMNQGGHVDSALDLISYAAILLEKTDVKS